MTETNMRKQPISIHWKLLLVHFTGALLLIVGSQAVITMIYSESITYMLMHSSEEFTEFLRARNGSVLSEYIAGYFAAVVWTFVSALAAALILGTIVTIRERLFFLHAILPVIAAFFVNRYIISQFSMSYSILYFPGRLVSGDLFTQTLINSLLLLSMALLLFLSPRILRFALRKKTQAQC